MNLPAACRRCVTHAFEKGTAVNKFLADDLDALKRKRDELESQMRERTQDMSEANSQSSETWHDNAPLDVAQREFERLVQRRNEIDQIIRNAVVVQVGKEAEERVTIGSEVTFVDQDDQKRTIKIGSHTPQEASGTVSYLAPVASILMGSKLGDVVDGKILDREVEYEITKIARWV